MNIVFTPTAWEQYTEWQREDKKMVKRINELIKDIDRNGLLTGIGKPEPLKHRKACSRRITDEHRLIYYTANCIRHNPLLFSFEFLSGVVQSAIKFSANSDPHSSFSLSCNV